MKVVVDASVIVKWVLPDPEKEPDLDKAAATGSLVPLAAWGPDEAPEGQSPEGS